MDFRFFNVSLDVLKLVCMVNFRIGPEIGLIIETLAVTRMYPLPRIAA